MSKVNVVHTHASKDATTLCRYVVIAEVRGKIVTHGAFASRKAAETAASMLSAVIELYEKPMAQFYESFRNLSADLGVEISAKNQNARGAVENVGGFERGNLIEVVDSDEPIFGHGSASHEDISEGEPERRGDED